MRGPIDFVIVGFEGNHFDGSILKALGDAIDKGIIALMALALVQKDDKGHVSVVDITTSGDDYVMQFSQKYQPDNQLIGLDDLAEVGDLLENKTSAGLLIIEQLWAKPLKKALIEAGGVLVSEGRIHPDAAVELNTRKES